MRDFLGRGDVHCRRKRIVRRLAHVDVIVRMYRRLGAARAAQHLVGAVGDHLVDVHVGLGAGAGLPDHQRELIVEPAGDDLIGGGNDRLGAACIERTELPIGFGGGALDERQRGDQRARHALFADAEIVAGALGLRAPIGFRCDLDRAERIGLGPGAGNGGAADRGGTTGSIAGSPVSAPPSSVVRRHFFLNRSRRTTSPPPVGPVPSSAAPAAGGGKVPVGCDSADASGPAACVAVGGSAVATPSAGWN